ncbi:MAG: hypothetical protein Q8S84_07010, partial [bacterium]|nr:hypothetical protein [bacterium]
LLELLLDAIILHHKSFLTIVVASCSIAFGLFVSVFSISAISHTLDIVVPLYAFCKFVNNVVLAITQLLVCSDNVLKSQQYVTILPLFTKFRLSSHFTLYLLEY